MIRAFAAIPIIAALLWLMPEPIPAPRELDLAGWYAVEGQDAEGNEYSGVCVIKQHGPNYRCSWLLNSGVTCVGVGAVEKDTMHVAAISGGGVCLFRLKVEVVAGKPVLSGYYATGDVRGKETLTLLRRPTL